MSVVRALEDYPGQAQTRLEIQGRESLGTNGSRLQLSACLLWLGHGELPAREHAAQTSLRSPGIPGNAGQVAYCVVDEAAILHRACR